MNQLDHNYSQKINKLVATCDHVCEKVRLQTRSGVWIGNYLPIRSGRLIIIAT